MLQIIKGTERSGKTQLLASMVQKSIEAERCTYIIIPDQFSLVYDRKLYDFLGAEAFNKITIVGPDRLAERLIEKHGSSGKYCDDNARLIMMYKACKEFEALNCAKYYSRSLSKGSFFENVCDTIDELRQSAYSADTLAAKAESLTGTVADKLYDISQLYSLYLVQLEKHGLKDTNSAMAEAVELIRELNYFENCDVYFDSFSSFTGDQKRMLEAIFAQANSVTAALTIGSGRNADANLTPFKVCIQTCTELEGIAKATGHTVMPHITADKYEYKSAAIRTLSDRIFAPAAKPSDCADGVRIVPVSDTYSEAEYVFAQIRSLVNSGDYKYGDIAVISRDLEECASVLDDMAYRYDVPLFCDIRKNVSQSSPVLFVNAVFDCIISKSFRTRSILSYIKSPLSNISVKRAADIEEYCFKWSVDGDMWLSEFTASDRQDKKQRRKELSRINDTRQKIIDDLKKLKDECTDATAGKISAALGSFMRRVGLHDDVFTNLKALSIAQNETSLEISRVFNQLWQRFLSAIGSIQDILANEKITAKEYYELLKTMLSQMTVSSPPQRLNSVIAASAQHTRLSDIKVAFIIGANDGHFPKNIHMQGLFSEHEKKMLKESADIEMEKRLETNIQAERFSCFQALSCPSHELYICVPSADRKGELLSPSPLISQIKGMFCKNITLDTSALGLELYCSTPKAALHKYAELIRIAPDKAAAIKAALERSVDITRGRLSDLTAGSSDVKTALEKQLEQLEYCYQQMLTIDSQLKAKGHSLDKSIAKNLLLKAPFRLSSTKMETYFKCPFQFFCHYGLSIRKPYKVEINSTNTGSINHKCLEETMMDENGRYRGDAFVNMTPEAIKAEVNVLVREYIKNEMGGMFGKDETFKAEVKKLKNNIVQIIRHVQEEMRNTDYIPYACEFKLTKDDGTSLLPIKVSEESDDQIEIEGSIDRVDTLELDGNSYVRIIDYKKGNKKFSFSNVYHGLNLQMLLYMLTVTSEDVKVVPDKQLMPAGVLYMRTGEVTQFPNKRELIDKEKKEVSKAVNAKPNAEEKAKNAEKDLVDKQEALDKKQAKLTEANGNLDKKHQNLDNALNTLKAKQEALDAAKSEYDKVSDDAKKAAAKQKQVDKAQKAVENTKAGIEKAKGDLDKAEEKLQKARDDIAKAEENLKKAKDTAATAKAAADALPDEVDTDKVAEKARAQFVHDTAGGAFSCNGIVADEPAAIYAMSKKRIKKFAPVTVTEGGGYDSRYEQYVLSKDSFNKILGFAKGKITDLYNKLSDGNIPPLPVISSDFKPCDYCDYSTVCGNADGSVCTEITKDGAYALFDEIGGDKTKLGYASAEGEGEK